MLVCDGAVRHKRERRIEGQSMFKLRAYLVVIATVAVLSFITIIVTSTLWLIPSACGMELVGSIFAIYLIVAATLFTLLLSFCAIVAMLTTGENKSEHK